VAVESAGDESTDLAAVEEKLLSLRKGRAKLQVVADRGLQVGSKAGKGWEGKEGLARCGAVRGGTGRARLGSVASSQRQREQGGPAWGRLQGSSHQPRKPTSPLHHAPLLPFFILSSARRPGDR